MLSPATLNIISLQEPKKIGHLVMKQNYEVLKNLIKLFPGKCTDGLFVFSIISVAAYRKFYPKHK